MADIAFDEAFFGEKNRAHAVLNSSCESEFVSRLAHQLDLPGQIPPSVKLTDYVSGFPFEDRYVIARTSLDSDAVRQGMVFSHAFIFSLTHVSSLIDMGSVFASLLRKRPTPMVASRNSKTFSLAPSDQSCVFPAVSHALLTLATGPVVIPSDCDFEMIIAGLWSNSLDGLRKNLSFRLSFGPDDIPEAGVTIVCTPPSMLSRWPIAQVVVDPTADVMPLTPAVSMLCGTNEPEFQNFMADLEVEIADFAILAKLNRAFVRLNQPNPSFAHLVSAARLVSVLQPDPRIGTNEKSIIIDRIINAGPSITVEDALLLRNFDTESFANTDTFWGCLTEWMQAAVESEEIDASLSTIFANADGSDSAIKSWREAIWEGFKAACKTNADLVSKCIWAIVDTEPALMHALLTHCPRNQKFGRALADQAALVALRTDEKNLTSILLSAGYAEAETEFQCQAIGPAAALSLLGDRGEERPNVRSIDRILDKLSGLEIVHSAESIEHPHLFKRASERLVSDPSLLENLDYESSMIQKLWASAILKDETLWSVGDHPEGILYMLIDRLLNGNNVEDDLLSALSTSPLANLLDYPRRHEAWSMFSPPWNERFLAATADAWIDTIQHTNSLPPTEAELAQVIGDDPYKSRLLTQISSEPISTEIAVFLSVDTLPEGDFSNSLFRRLSKTGSISADEIMAAGRLLMIRHWKRTVEQLIWRFRNRQDLRPLFQICSEYVPMIDGWMMRLHSPAEHEVWDLLKDTAVNLYSTGPSEMSLWERAGGYKADISVDKPGRQQWEVIIAQMKNGGVMSASHLVDTMLIDYPSNPSLCYLASHRLD